LAASTTTGVAASGPATTSTTNNIVDAMVTVAVTLGAITPTASTNILIWAYGSENGTTFCGAQSGSVEALGTDSAETIDVDGNNLVYLGSIHCHTASIQLLSKPMSIASAFGGIMPRKWGIIIQNQTGLALAASGHGVEYSEIYYN
jgi:hypothetical protein